jgi:hypothetical protein
MNRQAKSLQSKSRTHEIAEVNATTYTVKSGSSGNEYTVTLQNSGATCSCSWAQYRPRKDQRSGCSHTIAVYNHLAGNDHKVMAWASEEQAQKQHRPMISVGDGLTLTVRGQK